MPPYVISHDELDFLLRQLIEVVQQMQVEVKHGIA
jgi:adenosylmethionine-8-amino-7-oxononanoate aminotransferase